MSKEPKELYNGFLFLRTGDKVDSPLVAYTLNLESVNIDCLEEEFEEKIETLKNGKDVTIKLICNKAEVVSPERIVEYACGKQKRPEIVTCEDCIYWDTSWESSTNTDDHYCYANDRFIEGDFWCKSGERKVKNDGQINFTPAGD